MKKTLILIHGFRGDHTGLAELGSLLAADFNVLIPDLPGAGNEPPFPNHDLTRWLFEYITKRKLDRPVLVGHSMGSIIAARFQAAHPELSAAVIFLLAPIACGGLAKIFCRVIYTALSVLKLLPAAVRRRIYNARALSFLISRFLQTRCDRPRRKYYDSLQYNCFTRDVSAFEAMLKLSLTSGVTESAPRITAKTHIFVGTHDRLLSAKSAQKLARVFSCGPDVEGGAKITVFPGAGHLINFERPAALAVSIREALCRPGGIPPEQPVPPPGIKHPVSFSGVFVAVEMLVYLLYHTQIVPVETAYGAIVLCFLYVFINACNFIKIKYVHTHLYIKDFLLLGAAMFFTCIADIFLVMLHTTYINLVLGVVCFNVVQLFYAARIHTHSCKKEVVFGLACRGALFLTPVFMLVRMYNNMTLVRENFLLFVLIALYITNSLINIAYSILNIKKMRGLRISGACSTAGIPSLSRLSFMCAGLVLLFACDICAGLDFLNIIANDGVNIPWLFYIPSQICFALSSAVIENEHNKIEGAPVTTGAPINW